jgi:hypothetical protein
MTERLKTWIDQAGADWCVTVEIDDVAVFEESYLEEWDARAAAAKFVEELLRDLAGEATERAARVADAMTEGDGGTPAERAIVRKVAERIRGGRT